MEEYVEDATAAIASRQQRARDARSELRDHLESATETLMAGEGGMARAEAEEEATRRLGPVEVLREQYRLHYRPWAPVWPAPVAAAICLFLHKYGPAGVLGVWAVAWVALHARSFVAVRCQPWATLAPEAVAVRLRPIRPFAGAGPGGGRGERGP